MRNRTVTAICLLVIAICSIAIFSACRSLTAVNRMPAIDYGQTTPIMLADINQTAVSALKSYTHGIVPDGHDISVVTPVGNPEPMVNFIHEQIIRQGGAARTRSQPSITMPNWQHATINAVTSKQQAERIRTLDNSNPFEQQEWVTQERKMHAAEHHPGENELVFTTIVVKYPTIRVALIPMNANSGRTAAINLAAAAASVITFTVIVIVAAEPWKPTTRHR